MKRPVKRPEKPSWEIRVSVEVAFDGKVVGQAREVRGAFVEHVPYDPKEVGRLGGEVGRRVARRVAGELPVKP